MSKTNKNTPTKQRDNRELDARRQLLEDLFNDLYVCRRKVYWMNFVRGICLGFGTLLGGTVVVALIIWLLSLFASTPVIGDYIKAIITAIQSTHH